LQQLWTRRAKNRRVRYGLFRAEGDRGYSAAYECALIDLGITNRQTSETASDETTMHAMMEMMRGMMQMMQSQMQSQGQRRPQ
jgi:hypothetical protein